MIVSKHSLPVTSNRAFVVLFALIVLPLGITNAEDEKEDWSATRREFVERIEEFTREIEELRIEGDDIGVKHLAGQRDYLKGILPILDEILKVEQEHEKAKAGKELEGAKQYEAKLEALEGKFWRAERIGEMEGGLAELKILKKELAEEGDDKGRQRVEAFVADQAKLLQLVRDLHKIVETGDEKKTEKLEKQIDRHEESLGLRIEEFHLERHVVEERQEGEDVRELEAELKEVRKRLRELDHKSK